MNAITNNCTLIIDGNWLLMSRLGIVINDFDKRNSEDALEKSRDNLVDFLAQSVNKIINYFDGCIDNIIMVQDGGSWRKKYPKPTIYQDVYKGNRTTDANVNWDYIWDGLNMFCKRFHKENLTCTQEYSIEGDDWCWFWSRRLNENGCNAIIWSSDCDLKQLVQYREDKNTWTAWFNDRAGLVVPDRFDDSTKSEIDLFFEFDSTPRSLVSVIENVRLRGDKISYINPDSIRMEKVICGDSGDNIKSIVRTTTTTYNKKTGETKERVVKVSGKEWCEIQEELNIQNLAEFIYKKHAILDKIRGMKRHAKNQDSDEDVMEMFDYNLHMVILDEKYIPEEQQTLMEKQLDDYRVADLDYLKNNFKVLGSQNNTNTIEDLFNGLS